MNPKTIARKELKIKNKKTLASRLLERLESGEDLVQKEIDKYNDYIDEMRKDLRFVDYLHPSLSVSQLIEKIKHNADNI